MSNLSRPGPGITYRPKTMIRNGLLFLVIVVERELKVGQIPEPMTNNIHDYTFSMIIRFKQLARQAIAS